MLPVAGNVVFRSSWDHDAVYAMMLVEHGKAAAVARNRWGDQVQGAAGHEHPDNTAFTLYAYGEPLLIDSGYLGWDEHFEVNQPENHNILLVDGKGPAAARSSMPEFTLDDNGDFIITTPEIEGGYAPGGDGETWLLRSHLSPDRLIKYAEAYTRYHAQAPATSIYRRMIMLENRIVVIYDQGIPEDDQAHTLTFQLHGHGGENLASGSFAATEYGGRWLRGDVSLQAWVFGNYLLDYQPREAVHDSFDANGWTRATHPALDPHMGLGNRPTGGDSLAGASALPKTA